MIHSLTNHFSCEIAHSFSVGYQLEIFELYKFILKRTKERTAKIADDDLFNGTVHLKLDIETIRKSPFHHRVEIKTEPKNI